MELDRKAIGLLRNLDAHLRQLAEEQDEPFGNVVAELDAIFEEDFNHFGNYFLGLTVKDNPNPPVNVAEQFDELCEEALTPEKRESLLTELDKLEQAFKKGIVE